MQLQKYNRLRNRNIHCKLLNGKPHLSTPDQVPTPDLSPKLKSPPKVHLTPRERSVLESARANRSATKRGNSISYNYHYTGAEVGALPTLTQYTDMVAQGLLETPKLEKPLGQNF